MSFGTRAAGISDGRARSRRLPVQAVVTHPDSCSPAGCGGAGRRIRIRVVIRSCERRSRLTWALARGVRCSPSQVLVTAGFSGALGLAIRGLQLERMGAWMEDPGFPLTRTALGLAGMTVAAVPVDAEGLDVAAGVRTAPGAALAVVTPGQQAPLGMTMSLPRRLALLALGSAEQRLDHRGRLPERVAAERTGGSGSCISRSWRTGAAHRQFQQDDQPGAAPGFHGRAAGTGSPVRRARCLPGAGAGCGRAARCGGVPAGRALSSPSAPHEAALRRPTGEPCFVAWERWRQTR